jgi:hypothetical protein
MKTDTDCVFCKIVAGQMPCFKLLEDDNALAITGGNQWRLYESSIIRSAYSHLPP